MCPLAVSMTALMGTFAQLQGVDAYMAEMDHLQRTFGGFTNAEMTPQIFAPAVKMPVLMSQVKDDAWTDNPTDAQKTFDLLGSKEKELFGLEGTTRRFDGYNYFAQNPERMITFLVLPEVTILGIAICIV